MTYSIIARDLETGELGVAVQSRYFAAGRHVPCLEAALESSSRSFASPMYGYETLRCFVPILLRMTFSRNSEEATHEKQRGRAAGERRRTSPARWQTSTAAAPSFPTIRTSALAEDSRCSCSVGWTKRDKKC